MKNNVHVNVTTGIWFAGWMFTWGFLDQRIWDILLGIIIWPYMLGSALAM